MQALRETFASVFRLAVARGADVTSAPTPIAANTVSAAEINGVPVDDHYRLRRVRYEAGQLKGASKTWQCLNVIDSLSCLEEAGFVLGTCGYLGLPARGLNALLLGRRDNAGHLWAVTLLLGAQDSVAPGFKPAPTPVWRHHAKNWITVPCSVESEWLALKLQEALERCFPYCAIYLAMDAQHVNGVLALRSPGGCSHPIAARRLALAIDQRLIPAMSCAKAAGYLATSPT